MIRVAILGATGYTALELIQILLRHPEAQVTTVTSRQEESPALTSVHPQLAKRIDLRLTNPSTEQIVESSDCVFSCLPHAASAAAVAPLADAGLKIIDFSADYRLHDAKTFSHWYGVDHVDPDRLGNVVYGLPELFREQIKTASLVANPGCYPTSANLALAPLLAAKLIEADGIIIDSKSGVSGAGRTPNSTTHFPECNESLSAYNIGTHRHTPEIDQTLSTVSGQNVQVIFTPHLVPMNRGILTTTYSQGCGSVTQPELMAALHDFYDPQPWVRVVDHLPSTRDSAGTNFCDISARVVGSRVITVSCLDNLLKGASGMAVQNFNLMHGLDESLGL